MAIYSGQGVGLIDDIVPAASLVKRLVREAEAALEETRRSTHAAHG